MIWDSGRLLICLYTYQSVLNLRNLGFIISAVNCGNFAASVFMNVGDIIGVVTGLEEVDEAGGCCRCHNIAFMSPRLVIPNSCKSSLVKSIKFVSVMRLSLHKYKLKFSA